MDTRRLITRRNLIITSLFLLIIILIWINLLIPVQQPPTPNPSPEVINKQGDTILFENNDFQIVWLAQSNSYTISILSSPFAEIRSQAEQKLGEVLNKSPQDLCLFNVTVTTPNFANPDEAGNEYGLSFCDQTTPKPSMTINPNLTPLSVISVYPAGGEVEIGETTNSVFIDFNQPIDITSAVVLIEPNVEAMPRAHPRISGQLIIVPQSNWLPDTTYRATVKAGLLSKDRKFQLKENVVVEYQVKQVPFPDYPDDH